MLYAEGAGWEEWCYGHIYCRLSSAEFQASFKLSFEVNELFSLTRSLGTTLEIV